MCRTGKIKNSNVAGVNLSGIGIFVNQSIENKKVDAQTQTAAKVFAIGIVRGWTMFWVIVSSLLSIGAMAFCCACLPRIVSDINPHYDYLGIVIGVLALFITFVVAWNIWTAITTKEEIKKATEAADKLETLEVELNKQRTLFENRNLEIKHLIDAHARLREAENEKDLSYKYILYAEAIILLIQSNMNMSYEQFRNAREGLLNTINDFQLHADIDEVEDFINSEREYERCYQILMSLSTKRSEEIDKFRQGLTRVRELRMDAIRAMKNSDVGKSIKRRAAKLKKEMEDEEKRLRAKEAARKESESKDSTEV